MTESAVQGRARSSTWNLSQQAAAADAIAPATSSVSASGARWRHTARGTDADIYVLLLTDALVARAQAPWGVCHSVLRRLAQIASQARASDALLHATVADADAKRVFSGAHDFEWKHFEYFLFIASADEQRAAAERYETKEARARVGK